MWHIGKRIPNLFRKKPFQSTLQVQRYYDTDDEKLLFRVYSLNRWYILRPFTLESLENSNSNYTKVTINFSTVFWSGPYVLIMY